MEEELREITGYEGLYSIHDLWESAFEGTDKRESLKVL